MPKGMCPVCPAVLLFNEPDKRDLSRDVTMSRAADANQGRPQNLSRPTYLRP